MSKGENIKVAVRVRGFNDREREMNSKCVVEMNGNQTTVHSPNNEGDKTFAFDYSYWSFDGFKALDDGYLAPDGNRSRYCDQKRVFNDLGLGILQNAWDGYNSSIFAYGQTGSGKSYSIVGTGPNKGIVPQICEQLFEQIKVKQDTDKEIQLEVTFSMIEIYNEVVRDLLSSKGVDRKGLPIHERPGRGFQILEKDLKPTQVVNYAGIQKLMERGNANRIIAETKMNATSSRAHTIVEITFKQTFKNASGNMMQRVSVIDLIDLAGSERAAKAQTTGDRFKEGVAINLSLTSLGNCIAALAQQSSSGVNTKVPYRDSTLTKLLMNALGGNSKTVMIAAISPADNNYAETVSTLRYADRAKQIKCNAVVNEDPKDKLIRELQEEIMKLKGMVKGGVIADIPNDLSQKDYERIKKEMEESWRKQIENSEKEIESLKQSYEQRLADAQAKSKELDKLTVNEKANSCPHLSNINPDPMLTGSLKYLLQFANNKGKLVIGSSDKADIQINGLGISDRHCGVSFENGEFYVEPYANCRVVRNGQSCEEKFQMTNFDRLVFGASSYYLFVDPSKFNLKKQKDVEAMNAQIKNVTVEKVQQEIAEASGLITDDSKKTRADLECLNELIDLLPNIEEANQMSILLDKKVKYTATILNPFALGEVDMKVKPYIIVRKFGTTNEWIWDSQKFIDRKSFMSEMYLDVKEDGKVDVNKFKDFDPFCDSENEPVMIGTAVVEPRCILHRVPLEENAKIVDYQSKVTGSLNISLLPCDKQGIIFTNIGENIVKNPETQLKELDFIVRINNIKCMSPKFKRIFCQYRIFGDQDPTKTEAGGDTNNPQIQHQRHVRFDRVDMNLIKYYSNYPMFVQIYGVQVSGSSSETNKYSTREWFEKDKKERASFGGQDSGKTQSELEKLKAKMKNLETLLDYAEKKKKKKIKIEYVRECMLSNKPDVLDKLMDVINRDKDNS